MDEKKVREVIEDFRLEMQTYERMISYCEQFEPKTDCRSYKEIVAMYETAIEALEKQLPEKVRLKQQRFSQACKCSNCGKTMIFKEKRVIFAGQGINSVQIAVRNLIGRKSIKTC